MQGLLNAVSFGLAEELITASMFGFWLLPIVISVRVLVILYSIRDSQKSIQARLATIKHRLVSHNGARSFDRRRDRVQRRADVLDDFGREGLAPPLLLGHDVPQWGIRNRVHECSGCSQMSVGRSILCNGGG